MPKLGKQRPAIIGIGLSVVVMMVLATAAMAGDLQPGDPPASTMHTLGEIYDQVAALSGNNGPVIPSDSIFAVSTGINMIVEGSTQGLIEGSCTIEGREGTINVLGLEHAVNSPYDPVTGLLSGHRVHAPLKIVKYFDVATPRLFTAFVNSELLGKVEIKFYRKNVSNADILYYTIELRDARIVQIESMSPNYEKVSFVYQRIIWTYEDGGVTGEDDWNTSPR